MGYYIQASQSERQSATGLDGDPSTSAWITEPVRLYWPRDQNTAQVDVVILTGALAGRRAQVLRHVVRDDGDQYVQTEQELTALAAAMAGEKFIDADDNNLRPLPFKAASTYCWARAYEMTNCLKASGYKVGKFVLINRAGIRMNSIYGDDLPPDDNLAVDRATGFTWQWHIAPAVFLRNDNGPFVLDPSVLPTAAQPDEWTRTMNVPMYESMSYDTMVTRLLTTQSYPVVTNDQALRTPWLVRADDNVLQPPKAHKPQKRIDATTDGPWKVPGTLELSWLSVPMRLAVGALNTLRNNWLAAIQANANQRGSADPYGQYRVDLASANQQFSQLQPDQRNELVDKYPRLLKAAWDTFANTGVQNDVTALLNILSA